MRLAALLVAFLASAGPRSSAARPIPVVADTAAMLRLEDGGVLDGRRLTLPGGVNAAVYDSTRRILVVSYTAKLVADSYTSGLERPKAKRELHCLAYDLARRWVLWESQTELLPLAVHADRLVALKDEKVAILDLGGETRRTLREEAVLLVRGSTLVVRSGNDIEGIDLASGESSWRSPLAVSDPRLSAFCPDSVLFVAGAGWAAVDPLAGLVWEYPMRRGWSEGSDLPASILGVLGYAMGALTPVYLKTPIDPVAPPSPSPGHIESVPDRPLLRDGRLIASADTEAVCLSLPGGQEVWRKPLRDEALARLRGSMGTGQRERPGHVIVRDAGPAIAALGLGFTRDGVDTRRTDPPALSLLDPRTGSTLRRVRMGRDRFLRDYRRAPAGHLVLATDRLFALDDHLSIRDTLAVPAGHGEAVEFMDVDSAVLVRTHAGVFELDPRSLEMRWERRLGGGVTTFAPDPSGSRMWMIGRRGLLRYERGGAGPPIWIPFDAGAAGFSGGAAITLAERTVEVFPLSPASR